ncbi:DUF2290 domain-containing protein [Cellulomonas denverensis]|uniref:DUF2290 domain-containing protein n=1 Tax=Cellulomonas denverensis TaxID=264297 RepID=UPI003571653A
MLTSSRAVRDDIQNALDYLLDADLCLVVNPVAIFSRSPLEDGTRVESVRFVSHVRDVGFLLSHDHPGIDQYLAWIRSGSYSAVLFDGSLIQVTYDVSVKGEVVGHRLAYMPCPYDVDPALFAQESLQDAIELYYGSTDILLRSQLRFDFDPRASAPGHPAAHLTFNNPQCRIPCVAPVHVLRFLDFVFRHSYPTQRRFHEPFFASGSWRHLGDSVLTANDRSSPHLMWDIRATMSSAS